MCMYDIICYSGTYGGHLELTAFAHLKRRDVKVIQPGLVYVIEWTSGADLSPTLGSTSSLQNDDDEEQQGAMPEKEARKTRRERKMEMRAQARAKAQAAEAQAQMMEEDESSSSLGAVYVAYVFVSQYFFAINQR